MRRRYPTLWRRLGASLLLTLLFGCWRYQVRPANPAHLQEPFAYPRNEVFDAVLSQAHEMNLEVKVLEKASGLLRFETVQLSPTEMDQYCEYPIESTGCRQLPTSFAETEAWEAGGRGVMSITALVTATDADASMVDVRANGQTEITMRGVTRVYTVESTGILERQLITGAKGRLHA